MRRKQMKKQKQVIIICSLCLLLCLCVGYAAFNTQLSIRTKGNIKKDPGVDITENVVTEGDGLYIDEYEEGRYVYKGTNPNNYIEFDNGEIWRIVSKEADGTYKILKNDVLPNQVWDSTGSNDWTRPADLNTYLNGEYYDSLDSSIKDNIVSHTWGIGAVSAYNEDDSDYQDDLASQITGENEVTWTGNIGLLSVSDYLRSSSDMANCGTIKLAQDNNSRCRELYWMYLPKAGWWLISPYAGKDDIALATDSSLFNNDSPLADYYAPRPAAYLKSDITLSGSGTESDPYKLG